MQHWYELVCSVMRCYVLCIAISTVFPQLMPHTGLVQQYSTDYMARNFDGNFLQNHEFSG